MKPGEEKAVLTKAGHDAAAIDPHPVPRAGTTPESGGGIGPGAIAPPHADVARPTASAPLGPAAPAAVHWDTRKKGKRRRKTEGTGERREEQPLTGAGVRSARHFPVDARAV